MEKNIGATTYKVSVYFGKECAGTSSGKTLRLTKNDLQYGKLRATMRSPKTGRLAERGSVRMCAKMRLQKAFALAIAVIVVVGLVSCSGKPKPNEPAGVLTRFEKANNERDVQALIDCYDPDFVSFTKGILGIVGGVSGASDVTKTMDTLLPYLSRSFQDYVQRNDSYPMIRLEEVSTIMNSGKKATIKYTETLVQPSGKETSSEQTMAVVKVDDVWYIAVSFSPDQWATNPSNIKPYDSDTDVAMQEILLYSGDEYQIIQRPYIYVDPGYLSSYDNGLSGADKRYGLVLKTESETTQITEAIYDGMGSFSEGLCAVRAYDTMSGESKWGFVDESGALIVPFKYDEVEPFYNGYAKVRIGKSGNTKNEKWGIVDKTGVEVIPVEYTFIRELDLIVDGYITVGNMVDSATSLVNYKYGKFDIECQISRAA